MPEYFKNVHDKHVTLLYAGGAATEDSASRRAGISVHDFAHYRSECERCSGQKVQVVLDRVVQDAEMTCVTVVIPKGLVCVNEHPHITLAHSPQVGPVYANMLLKRTEGGEDATGVLIQRLGRERGPPTLCLQGVVRPFWGYSTSAGRTGARRRHKR